MDTAIKFIKEEKDVISKEIASKLCDILKMPENKREYEMVLLQPKIDLCNGLEKLIEFCSAKPNYKNCPICSTKMKGVELIHYKCEKCNEYFTN
jgi:hypothetical protein